MLIKTKAYDKAGNEYEKNVTISIKFGWPAEYSLASMLEHYPFDKGLCIDMGGRNHKGIPDVTVPAENMNFVIESILTALVDGMNLTNLTDLADLPTQSKKS